MYTGIGLGMVEFRQHNRITTTKLSTTYKQFSDKSKPTLDRITICSLYTKEVRSMKDIKVLFMPIIDAILGTCFSEICQLGCSDIDIYISTYIKRLNN
jgi:hypothetical protein